MLNQGQIGLFTFPASQNAWPNLEHLISGTSEGYVVKVDKREYDLNQSIGISKESQLGNIVFLCAFLDYKDQFSLDKSIGISCFSDLNESISLNVAQDYSEFSFPLSDETTKYLLENPLIFSFLKNNLNTIRSITGDVPIGLEYLSDKDENWEKLYVLLSLDTEDTDVVTSIENQLYEEWLLSQPSDITDNIVISFI